MKTLNYIWTQSRVFAQTLGLFFSIFDRGQGRLPPCPFNYTPDDWYKYSKSFNFLQNLFNCLHFYNICFSIIFWINGLIFDNWLWAIWQFTQFRKKLYWLQFICAPPKTRKNYHIFQKLYSSPLFINIHSTLCWRFNCHKILYYVSETLKKVWFTPLFTSF